MSDGPSRVPAEETPSQAEGERDDGDGMAEATRGARREAGTQPPRTTPSQAEGEDDESEEGGEEEGGGDARA